MKFKEGDRVRVLRWKDNDVNFYTTLAYANYPGFYHMSDSSDSYYNELTLLKEYSHYFGKKDYYVLAEDEEDTEEPVIQHINNMYNEVSKEKEQKQKVELKKQYIIEVKKGLYVDYVDSKEAFYFTKDITKACVFKNREYPTKFAEIIDAKILEIKRYVEVWVYGATRKISLIQCRR